MSKRTLTPGGAGFIGSHLADERRRRLSPRRESRRGPEHVRPSRLHADDNAGTAILLEALRKQPVERLVVASSMSIYGEGLYLDARGHRIAGGMRSLEQLKARDWELRDSRPTLSAPDSGRRKSGAES